MTDPEGELGPEARERWDELDRAFTRSRESLRGARALSQLADRALGTAVLELLERREAVSARDLAEHFEQLAERSRSGPGGQSHNAKLQRMPWEEVIRKLSLLGSP